MRELRIKLPDELWDKFPGQSPQKMKSAIATVLCTQFRVKPEPKPRKQAPSKQSFRGLGGQFVKKQRPEASQSVRNTASHGLLAQRAPAIGQAPETPRELDVQMPQTPLSIVGQIPENQLEIAVQAPETPREIMVQMPQTPLSIVRQNPEIQRENAVQAPETQNATLLAPTPGSMRSIKIPKRFLAGLLP